MSDLTNTEKRSLERLLGMGSGYVLDFSNRTFDEFIMDSVGKSIYDSAYDYGSGSKANRMRAFWTVEPNHIVGKLLEDLVIYAAELYSPPDGALLEVGKRIAHRLLQSAPVPEIAVISPNTPGRDFATLAKSVREAIEKNEPEAGLDRLHTFVVRYVKVICEKRGIATDRGKPLHGLVGEYVKRLKQEGRIESEMTERILKSTISTLESFNQVRNDHSFAHDNPVLNYEESLLIFNHVTSCIRFLEAIERAENRLLWP
jgi:hypothetical protein